MRNELLNLVEETNIILEKSERDTRIKKAVTMAKGGASDEEISKKLGVTKSTIQSDFEKVGFNREKLKKKETERKTKKDTEKYDGPKSKEDTLGGNVETEKRIVTLLDRLAKAANSAKEQGKDAPSYDLCKASIPGTNLFCAGNKGIPREKMPQLKGSPVPGSKADKLPKKDGEVDTEALFKQALKDKGIKMSKTKSVDSSSLKATQSQLVGAKVAGMLQALKKDPNHPKITAPIYISKDGYILDGHHRWAAQAALDLADGGGKSVKMDVVQVDMGAKDLVKFTNDFADDVGISQKAAGKKKDKKAA